MKMKKLLLVVLAVMLAGTALASGWDNYTGTLMSPVVSGYFSTLYTNTLSAISGKAITVAATDTLKTTLANITNTLLADTAKVKGLSVGNGTMIKKIITGTQTFTALATVDTTVISGAVVASRVQITFKGSAVLTGVPVARTTVDSLFVTCAIADTAKAKASGYDYILFNE